MSVFIEYPRSSSTNFTTRCRNVRFKPPPNARAASAKTQQWSAPPALWTFRRLDRPPDLLRLKWHIQVADAERAERVEHCVDHARCRTDRARLANALDPQRIER